MQAEPLKVQLEAAERRLRNLADELSVRVASSSPPQQSNTSVAMEPAFLENVKEAGGTEEEACRLGQQLRVTSTSHLLDVTFEELISELPPVVVRRLLRLCEFKAGPSPSDLCIPISVDDKGENAEPKSPTQEASDVTAKALQIERVENMNLRDTIQTLKEQVSLLRTKMDTRKQAAGNVIKALRLHSAQLKQQLMAADIEPVPDPVFSPTSYSADAAGHASMMSGLGSILHGTAPPDLAGGRQASYFSVPGSRRQASAFPPPPSPSVQ